VLQLRRALAVLAIGIPAACDVASAQTDYRNLDGERPTFIADAYPIERWAFELSVPWRFEHASAGTSTHILGPEISYGLFRNGQVGLSLPLASVDQGFGTEWGLAGVHAFGLYNLTTESGSWWAMSVRMDLALPVGSNGGTATRAGAQFLATRSFGAQRIHVNLAGAFGEENDGGVEALPDWSAGAAVDRTFIRESLLLIGEVYALRHSAAEPTEAIASLGARWQLSPTLVVDGGIGRRLSNAGPDVTVTLGLSHAFAISALLPSVHRAQKPGSPR
jgi:hypothetical protein